MLSVSSAEHSAHWMLHAACPATPARLPPPPPPPPPPHTHTHTHTTPHPLTNITQSGADDARGVGEPLNETACGCLDCDCPGLVARGKHWLLLAPKSAAARLRRTLQQEANDPALLAFSTVPHHIGRFDAAAQGSVWRACQAC